MAPKLEELPQSQPYSHHSIHSAPIKYDDSAMNHEVPDIVEDERASQEKQSPIRPTAKRYLILLLFCLDSAGKAFLWTQIPAGTKKISYYYGVDSYVINAVASLSFVSYLFLSLPSCFVIKRIGIRRTILVVSLAVASAAAIRCLSCRPGGIVLLFLAQAIASLGITFNSIPTRLASVWFPDHQVSTAVSFCIFGNQLGVAFSFVVTQWLLNGAETREEIGQSLMTLYNGTAAFTIFSFVLNFLLFDDAPKHAPGIARFKQIKLEQSIQASNQSILDEIRQIFVQLNLLIRHKEIVLLNLSFSIGFGVKVTCVTLLNQTLGPHWPGNDMVIGNTGFCIITFGALCSVLWGRVLDRTRKYLLVNILLNIAHIISILSFTYAVTYMHSEWTIYLAAATIGVSQVGLLVSAMEFAIELSYPASELVTAIMMNTPPRIFGVLFVFVGSFLVENYGILAVNAFYVSSLIISLILLLCIKEKLNRQNAVTEGRKSTGVRIERPSKVVAVDGSR